MVKGDQTDIIITEIRDSRDQIKSKLAKIDAQLDGHEKRIQRLETSITVQGWKIGAIVAVMMAFGGITWSVIKVKLQQVLGIS